MKIFHKSEYRYPLYLAIIVLLVALLIEYRYPYYFLQDDNRDGGLPLVVHNYRSLLSGELAVYNFHQFLGMPQLALGQSAVLYPITYICVFLSKIITGDVFGVFDVQIILYLIIGSVGMYLFVKTLIFDEVIAVFCGFTWVFCGFSIFVGSSWHTIVATVCYFPYMLFFTLKMYQTGNTKYFFGGIVSRLLLFYCGFIQFFIYSVVFEFLFVLLLIFVELSHQINKSDIRSFIKKYFLSYFVIVVCSLPLLLPMWHQTQISAFRSNALLFKDICNWQYEFFYLLNLICYKAKRIGFCQIDYVFYVGYIGLLFAVIFTYMLIWRTIKFILVDASRIQSLIILVLASIYGILIFYQDCRSFNSDIQLFLSYFSLPEMDTDFEKMVFFYEGLIRFVRNEGIILIIFLIIQIMRDKYQNAIKKMFSIENKISKFPSNSISVGILFFIALFWATSLIFSEIIYVIPLLNRFRWLFKLMIFAEFFFVVMSGMGMWQVKNILKFNDKINRRVVWILFGIQVVNLSTFYILSPQMSFTYHLDKVPLVESRVKMLSDGRYVTFGSKILNKNQKTLGTLAFYYGTLFGLNNFSGYIDPLISASNMNIFKEKKYDFPSGAFRSDIDVNYLRRWGVKWYIFSSDYYDDISIFNKYNIKKVAEDETRIIYCDQKAYPFAYFIDKDGALTPVNCSTTTNNILLNTDFPEPRMVTLNYLYNEFFVPEIDGKGTELIKTSENKMQIFVPAGKHSVAVKYHDPYFEWGVRITGICLVFGVIWGSIFMKVRNQ